MAQRPSARTIKTLRQRYGHRLDAIREKYEAEARGLDAQARALRREARAHESDYRVLAREYRKEIASLKKAGLVSRDTDIRKVKPDAALSRVLNEYYDVVQGKSRTVKIDRATERKLRAEGFSIRNGRVVVEKRLTVRNREVVERTTKVEGMQTGRTVRRVRLDTDIEAQLERIAARMGPDDYIAVDLGGSFSRVFGRDDMEDFANYLEGGGSFQPRSMSYVTLITMPRNELATYFRGMAKNKMGSDRDKRNARRRARYARKKGKGHGGRDSKNRG